MKNNTSLWVAGIAAVAVIAAGGYYLASHKTGGSQSAALSAPLATPPGITLQFMGRNAQGYSEQDHLVIILQPTVGYADAKGMTLYTYDKDTVGQSACTGDCLKTFPPALAPADARPVAGWSVIARDDGGKQWALNGKPLYTYAKDKVQGESGGNDAGKRDEAGSNYKPGYKRSFPAIMLPPDAHVAILEPPTTLAVPHGISAMEVGDANGIVLTDGRGMTLYAFDGKVDDDRPSCATPPCPSHWAPAVAPALANPLGDFTVASRNDGLKQWVYKGKPLYTYDGDLQASFANGIGVDPRWHVASVLQFFMPQNVRMGQTPGRGAVFTTADGRTLYKRDGFAFQSGGGHTFRHGVPNRPAVGRMIGTGGCDAECLKTWHPYAAPADAQPQGYWEVATRGDGSKQWVYQGYALYTYDGDKKPGDMTGNDIYDIAFNEDPNKAVDVGPQMTGTAALYWGVITP